MTPVWVMVPYVTVTVLVCVVTHFSAGGIHYGTLHVVLSPPAVLAAADVVVVAADVAGPVAGVVSAVSRVTGPLLAPLVVVVWVLHG